MSATVIRMGLETLYFTGAHRLAQPLLAGIGTILTFHRVRPPRNDPFQPNRILEISPQFLDVLLLRVRDADIDIVTIDEAHRRLVEGGRKRRRFVVLTFDDGYRDNLTYALPVLKRHGVPFVVYVASAFADGRGELWWLALELAIAANDRITAVLDGEEHVFDCATREAQQRTWAAIYRWLRQRHDDADLRRTVRQIADAAGIDMREQCGSTCMDWSELACLMDQAPVTIGAHTVDHRILSEVPVTIARAEMANSVRRIEMKLGVKPTHFAYPVGDVTSAGRREFALAADLGFATAVTTRPGVLFPDHANHLTALPRISVNGAFQRLRYIDVLLSGSATALWNGFRRVAAA
jgi:peptidoglycan/xylan/chitin deacetylase (PgdA/CDA1 family)